MECPVCHITMAEIDVAPCFDCGDDQSEIMEFKKGRHQYYLYTLLGQEIVLCDFCDADFDSYDYNFFGFSRKQANNYQLSLVKQIDQSTLTRDYYCCHCKRRLAFLRFLENVRAGEYLRIKVPVI